MLKSIQGLILHDKDSVAVALENVNIGDQLYYELTNDNKIFLTATGIIPLFHKFAIKEIKPGEDVYKYGQIIGRAITNIFPGSHVHTHNIVSLREGVNQEELHHEI